MRLNIFERIRRRIEDADINVSLVAMAISINSVTAILKMIFAYYLHSFWLFLHATYFIVIGYARYRTMKNYIEVRDIQDFLEKYRKEFEFHNNAGTFVFFIGMTYLFASIRMFRVGDVVLIGGILVYWFVFFTLIKFIFAIYGMVVTRGKHNPIIRAMKVIGTVDACLSIVPTLYTSLSYFGFDKTAEYSSVVGMVISVGVMISGIIMANRRRQIFVDENSVQEYIKKVESEIMSKYKDNGV